MIGMANLHSTIVVDVLQVNATKDVPTTKNIRGRIEGRPCGALRGDQAKVRTQDILHRLGERRA